MQKRKELRLGNSDFKSIMDSNSYFVDKSMFISEVINAEKDVILLPRPRRFGKTLNLSMLRYFFDIQQPENQKLFTDLKIWQCEDEIKAHQGKYPVIYMSFKDAKANNWEATLKHLINEIIFTYKQHRYLLDTDILFTDEKYKFEKILNETAHVVDYENSIKILSEYLERYYKQKVVILTDEYDTPIQAGYKLFYEEVISFMRNLLSGAFKDNVHLFKGAITGILRVSRESIFSGLNNLTVHSILDNRFSSSFGFTETEVIQILQDFDVETPYQEIKYWYDGYKIGNTNDIYNPWSILNYVVDKTEGFKTYWINTSSDSLLRNEIQKAEANYIRQDLQKLINNETIEKSIEVNFVFPDLDRDNELLWTLLLFSGYLTITEKVNRKNYTLKIPNYEIKTVFQDIIINWLKTNVRVKSKLLENTTQYLITNQLEQFEEGFREIMGDTFSYFDTAKTPEFAYQSYVLGLLAIIGDDYIIKSNRESGSGRYDIMLIPHDKSRYGIVIEIKTIETVDKVNESITDALAQIETKKYYTELIANNIPESQILKIPIVFVGKTPYVQPVEINTKQ